MSVKDSKKLSKPRIELKQSKLVDSDDRARYPQFARMIDLLDHQFETARYVEDKSLYGDMIITLFTLLDTLDAIEDGNIEEYEAEKASLINHLRVAPPELGKEI